MVSQGPQGQRMAKTSRERHTRSAHENKSPAHADLHEHVRYISTSSPHYGSNIQSPSPPRLKQPLPRPPPNPFSLPSHYCRHPSRRSRPSGTPVPSPKYGRKSHPACTAPEPTYTPTHSPPMPRPSMWNKNKYVNQRLHTSPNHLPPVPHQPLPPRPKPPIQPRQRIPLHHNRQQ